MCRRDRGHWRLIGYWENCSSAGRDFQKDSEPSRSPATPCNEQTQGRSSLIKALVAQAMRALQQDSFIFWTGGRKHCQKKAVEQILFIAGPRVSRAGNVCAFQRGNKRNILQEGMTCHVQHRSQQRTGRQPGWRGRKGVCISDKVKTQACNTVSQLHKKTHIMKGSQVYSTGKSSSQLAHPERRLLRNAKANQCHIRLQHDHSVLFCFL